MICFLTVPQTNRFTISEFLFEYAPQMVPKIRFIDVDRIANGERVDAKTWIFVGLDEATDAKSRSQLLAVEAKLRNENQRVFNLPSRVLGRFEMLKRLREMGINTYNVHDADPTQMVSWRFPVFVRPRYEHERTSILLQCPADAERLFAQHPQLAGPASMVAEYVDTVEKGGVHDGIFRKYSVQRIGDRYIARHVIFSRNWITKTSDLFDQAFANEDAAFVGLKYALPPAPEVVMAFETAGIEYGRIDYGMHKGKPQIWEINVNPVVVPRLGRINSLRHKAQKLSAKRVCDAFEAILK